MIPALSRFAALNIALVLGTLAITETTWGQRNIGNGTTRDIGRNVYAIDNLADQMAFRYGWELQFNRGCKDSIALYKHMRNHTKLTNELIIAYRGKCSRAFQKAACEVRESLVCIENLRKKSRVSESVTRLIVEALPIAAFINEHSSCLRTAPVYTGHLSSKNGSRFNRRG